MHEQGKDRMTREKNRTLRNSGTLRQVRRDGTLVEREGTTPRSDSVTSAQSPPPRTLRETRLGLRGCNDNCDRMNDGRSKVTTWTEAEEPESRHPISYVKLRIE